MLFCLMLNLSLVHRSFFIPNHVMLCLGLSFPGARNSRPFLIPEFPGMVMANSRIKREWYCNCKFQYDITQTVHLTSGSRSGARRMRNAVTSYRQAMPSALSTTHVHSPLSSNHRCWGCKLWPRAHITAHGPTPDGASCTDSYQQWLSTQQCPTSSATVTHVSWVTTATSSVTACVALHSTGWLAALSNCI